jgi:hypothetical protein
MVFRTSLPFTTARSAGDCLTHMPLPWAAILRHGPAIVEAPQGLFAIQTKKTQERQQSVDVRLDQLENASLESARLLQELRSRCRR